MIEVGGIRLSNAAILAPMSGVSDLPFRRLVARFGAGLVISEMVACDPRELRRQEHRLRAEGSGLAIHAVQLSGREADAMRLGVDVAEAAGATLIDINMGCPAKKVTGGYGGAALMRDLDHAVGLIRAVVSAASVPVTLKMRLGWDERSLNAAELARRAVDVGVAMITVHGRTRCQFYSGAADWEAIFAVAQTVPIPVIANGDLTNPQHAPSMLRRTGCDGVMIGRGACGRPWIVGQAGAILSGQRPIDAPTGLALGTLVEAHYQDMLSHHGERIGVRMARKHLGWYLDANPGVPPALRRSILTETDPRQVVIGIRRAFGAAADLSAAA